MFRTGSSRLKGVWRDGVVESVRMWERKSGGDLFKIGSNEIKVLSRPVTAQTLT